MSTDTDLSTAPISACYPTLWHILLHTYEDNSRKSQSRGFHVEVHCFNLKVETECNIFLSLHINKAYLLLESWSFFVTLSCASDETSSCLLHDSVVASHSVTSASTFLRVASTLWHSPSWLKHLKSCNVCLNQPLTVLRCTRTLCTTTFYVSNKQDHKYSSRISSK